VTIEGPYGCIRPLRQFDSVVLLAGSTGATFTLPLLRDIVQGWKENINPDTGRSPLSIFGRQPGAATRHVRFVWVVKSKGQFNWLSEQLSSVSTEVQKLQDELRDIKLELTIYVTCDESLTEEHTSLRAPIIAPSHDAIARKEVEHGTVQYRSQSISKDEALIMEKEDLKESITVATNKSGQTQNISGTSTTCCCRTEVDDSAPAVVPHKPRHQILKARAAQHQIYPQVRLHRSSQSFPPTLPSPSTPDAQRRGTLYGDPSSKLWASRRSWYVVLADWYQMSRAMCAR
jgi:hypothetical protein